MMINYASNKKEHIALCEINIAYLDKKEASEGLTPGEHLSRILYKEELESLLETD